MMLGLMKPQQMLLLKIVSSRMQPAKNGLYRNIRVITLAYYSNIPVQTDYLNVSPSTTSTAVSQANPTTTGISVGSTIEPVITQPVLDTYIDPTGTYNVIRLDNRSFESQINFSIP
jgi:hypothetical protein